MPIIEDLENQIGLNDGNPFYISFEYEDKTHVGVEFSEVLSEVLRVLENQKYSGSIIVKVSDSLRQIDHTALSILLLICKQVPSIIVDFQIKQNTDGWKNDNTVKSIKAYLFNFILFSSFSAGKLNIFVNGEDVFKREIIPINWKYPSSTVLPVIYIDKNDKRTIEILSNYDLFWKTKAEIFDRQTAEIFRDFEKGQTLKPSEVNEKAYQHLCRNYLQRQGYSIYHFIILMYAKCLKELRSFYLIENDRSYFLKLNEHQKTFLKSKEEPFRGIVNSSYYFRILEKIDTQLKTKTPLFILVFSFLFNEYLDELEERDRKGLFPRVLERKIEEIFSLTEGIVLGLFEVLRNVTEHSTSGKGVVSFRVYNEKEIVALKKEVSPEIVEFISTSNKKNGEIKYVDINLYDLSTLGIIDTYREKSANNINLKLSSFFNLSNTTTEENRKKFDNNYGLLFFASQVLTNEGFFRVSTLINKQGIQYISNSNVERTTGHVNGTSYSIIFPLKKEIVKPRSTTTPTLKEEFSVEGESEFVKYSILEFEEFTQELENPIKNSHQIFKINLENERYKSNELLRENFFPIIKDASSKLFALNEKTIFLIDALTNANEYISNPGNLQRLIDDLQTNENTKHVIILIPNDSFLRGVIDAGINKSYKNPILVYFKEHNYFKAFILNSTSKEDLLLYNYVYNNIPEHYIDSVLKIEQKESLQKVVIRNSNLIYEGSNKIKEFDSLIQHDGRSLYSYFLEKCLNTDITETQLFNRSNKNFQGYRISDGHFRLGSKVHIKDFFYAKRLFQVSNVVSHLAFEIVNFIKSNKNLFDDISAKGVNIIGYAKYSELLLYRIQQLLQYIIPDKEIEYNTYKDYESESLLHETNNLDLPFLILVPISSTFSTSIKIKAGLENLFGNRIKILQEYLNIINVADRTYSDYLNKKIEFSACVLLTESNWNEPTKEQIHNRIVEISNNEQHLYQKHFIQLFTDWHNISNCKLCFGDSEPPLIETDKASVTPLLIFGEPVKFPEIEYDNRNRECQDFHKYHYYGHYRIERKDNIHFIDPIEFLKANDERILVWFSEIKNEIQKRINNVRVSIISPDGNYNSTFVHFVNKYLLNNIANVILFNAESDYISNFKEFYGDILDNSDCIIYVDDQISTGNTLLSISQYLSNCDSKKFSFLITMISRLNNSDLEKINSNRNIFNYDNNNEKNLYIFQQYNIPTVISSHLECPICLQRRHYKELSMSASLDVTEYYIYKKIQRLNHKGSIPGKKDYKFRGYDTRVNEWITPTKDIDISNFVSNPFKHDTSLKFCIEEYLNSNLYKFVEKSVIKTNDYKEIIKGINRHILFRLGVNSYSFKEISLGIIKVISQPPFINYYSIRKLVFQILESGLIREFSKLQKRPINDQVFRVLKLYFKRLSALKSNFLIKRHNYNYLLALFNKLQERSQKEKGIKYLLEQRVKHIEIVISYLKNKGLENIKDFKGLEGIISSRIEYDTSLQFAIIDVISGKYISLFKEYWNNVEGSDISFIQVVYSTRALKNIENILKTRSDFHYYIATLIKEISKDNEIKSIYLEKNITEWFEQIRQGNPPHILRMLVRTIKLENTGIIKKYGDMVLHNVLLKADFRRQVENQRSHINVLNQSNQTFNYKEKSIFFQSVLDQLFSNSPRFIGKILPLLEFLDIEMESSCITENNQNKTKQKISIDIANRSYQISESFFHFMMLSWFLEIDGKKNIDTGMKSLSEKMKFINDRILDILQIKTGALNSDVYCFVFHKQLDSLSSVTNDNCSLYSNTDSNLDDWDLSSCLLQYLTKGMRQRDGGGTQNILEFIKENGSWRSLKKYFKSTDENGHYEFSDKYEALNFQTGFLDNFFEGRIKFKDKSHLLFYRITKMEYHEKMDESNLNKISEIVVKPQAIIIIASNKSNYLKAEKIRYLLLLKKHLSEFFHHHYENDSYNTALQQLKENSFYKDLGHGTDYYARTVKSKHVDITKNLENELTYYKSILNKEHVSYMPYRSSADDIYDEANNEELKGEFNLFFNLSLNQFRIATILVRFQNDPKRMLEYLALHQIYSEKFDSKMITDLITKLGVVVGKTTALFDNFGEKFFNHTPVFEQGFVLNCHQEILEIIFSEILVNIKKANNIEVASVEINWNFKTDYHGYRIIEILNSFNNKQRDSGFGLKMVNKIMHNLYGGSVFGCMIEENLYKTTLKFAQNE